MSEPETSAWSQNSVAPRMFTGRVYIQTIFRYVWYLVNVNEFFDSSRAKEKKVRDSFPVTVHCLCGRNPLNSHSFDCQPLVKGYEYALMKNGKLVHDMKYRLEFVDYSDLLKRGGGGLLALRFL